MENRLQSPEILEIYKAFHPIKKIMLNSFSQKFLVIVQNFKFFYNFTMSTHKKIDEEVLNNLLYLSRLSPESTNIETLKKQVDEIIGYFDILSKYDDSENPYDAYPSTQAEKLREDSCVEGLNIPDVKNISKNFMDGYFQVPKVLES